MTFHEFKLTALKVLRNNIAVFVILGLFPFCVGLGTPGANWATLAAAAVLLPGVYFLILLTVAVLQQATDVKNERAGNVTFGGAIGYELLLASVLALVLTLVLPECFQNHGLWIDFVLSAFSAGMGVLVLHCWPRRIRFTNGAIVQRNLFGGLKSIALCDIAAARFDAKQQCILITGRNGIGIVHSALHARREQFAQQLAHLGRVRVSGLDVQRLFSQ